jgi:hypothetical protein
MDKRCLGCIAVLLLLFPLTAGAQSALGLTSTPARVDGVFTDKEYSLVTEDAGMKLGLTWTADVLYIGLSAPTTGWVAAGIGSMRMDGAVIYIGYAVGQESQLKVQEGAGHRHADLNADAPRGYAVKEAGGRTVLELALDASSAISKNQAVLQLVFAMGAADSFSSMHRARSSVSVGLAR